jgi:hypothetical protein
VTHRDLLRVILWMTGALLSFSTMAVSIRGLATTLHIFEILAIRSASGLVILLAIGLAKPDLLFAVNLRRARLQLSRNIIHFGARHFAAAGHGVRARIHHAGLCRDPRRGLSS